MDIGVIGLGVMGENLIENILSRGYTVGIYNRTAHKTHTFIKRLGTEAARGFESLHEMVSSLKSPRVILIMVKAGEAIDQFMKTLLEQIEPKDVVIDGGNSNYHDTVRRCALYEGKCLFIGCGISGGEEGARNGPSIMPGGHADGWPVVSELLQSISAIGVNNKPCCNWIGASGSGHLVKTVHNGIEYAEMQILSDFYQIFRGELQPDKIRSIFESWRSEGSNGFLIDAAVDILQKKENGQHIIDLIVDTSEQKGTGKWTAIESINENVCAPVIVEAVNARILSGKKSERVLSSGILPSGADVAESILDVITIDDMRKGFMLCRAISYIQGLNLIKTISGQNTWNISLKLLCEVWSNGCIIRSDFLKTLSRISESEVLFSSAEFIEIANEGIAPLRQIVARAVQMGISIPCITSALSHYDALRTKESSGNMIQALRDYFGAHTLQLSGSSEYVHITWK
ncbi:6-phosphogluconate dehydrogenase [Nematocida ausubeli]|nr:6-phosphogluconate dehydrogenase [Nematocida ausubeli]